MLKSVARLADNGGMSDTARTLGRSAAALLLVLTLVGASGCGVAVNKARGQRNRANLINAVLQRETLRLDDLHAAGTPAPVEDYERVIGLYEELTEVMARSGSGVPRFRQQAEWDIVDLGEEVRGLEGYRTWSEQERETFEELFAKNALKKRQLR